MRILNPKVLFCGAFLLSTAACATRSADNAWVELGNKRFDVEIADDDAERARGLMFRDQMAADHGMLFVHDFEEPQAYWMKNTHIPLDILYFDSNLKLVAQQRNVPPCSAGDMCPSYPSDVPAKYVLELNAGNADTMNLRPGAKLVVSPGVIKAE